MADFDFLLKIDLFRKGLHEQKAVWRDFWEKGKQILEDSAIELDPLPRRWTTLRHNYFSVLFIVIFFLLKIPLPRLRLYARLNHCLRVWVTACDNLLDDELKEMLLTDLPGDARIFKSVHTILVTDRIFFSFLLDAVRDGTINPREMELLLRTSLSSLAASGIEEAEEEHGVDYSISPRDVIYKVHLAKTGLLFTSPLTAPLLLGDIHDDKKTECIRQGLCHFGLGCQILDDLTDLEMDLYNRKYNYLAALILHGKDSGEKQQLSALLKRERSGEILEYDATLYQQFPKASKEAKKEAMSQFQVALEHLCEGGLPFNKSTRQAFIKTLMVLLGHPRLLLHIRG